jgi:hypothetical protein
MVEIDGEDGLRCLMSYRAFAHVQARARHGEGGGAAESAAAAARLLDRLGAA